MSKRAHKGSSEEEQYLNYSKRFKLEPFEAEPVSMDSDYEQAINVIDNYYNDIGGIQCVSCEDTFQDIFVYHCIDCNQQQCLNCMPLSICDDCIRYGQPVEYDSEEMRFSDMTNKVY